MLRRVPAALALLALLGALALLSFALPVRVWRTGELPAPPLALADGGPAVDMPRRLWIDADAACGHSATTDPDDCLALLLLARTPGVEIAGVSAVQGNAPLEVTARTTGELAAMLGVEAAGAGDLESALREGPLTIVALGPLTNIAAVLEKRPGLRRNVARLVAVMGRRPGHLFHPSEGAGGGMLFGHGPVFRDFNFEQDRDAAARILGMSLPVTLVPYAAARQVSLGAADLSALEAKGGAARWVASRARGWLGFWQEDVGRDGFYPFDVLAAAYVLQPALFDCAATTASVARDEKLWGWVYGPEALLVGAARDDARASAPVLYCPQVDGRLQEWIRRAFQL